MLNFHFDFLGHFWWENGCGLGSPNPAKKLAHWVDPLGQPLSRDQVFEIFKGEPTTQYL